MTSYYKVISEFYCTGNKMIIVKVNNNIHVMSEKDWKHVYGKLNPNRWKTEDNT